jgi:hypothetical protein
MQVFDQTAGGRSKVTTVGRHRSLSAHRTKPAVAVHRVSGADGVLRSRRGQSEDHAKLPPGANASWEGTLINLHCRPIAGYWRRKFVG